MLTARLIDNVWATRKAESLNGLKFMLAEVIGGGPEEGKRLVVVDGFLVSDNVEALSLTHVDTQFQWSDHNPVELKFRLKD